MARVKVRYKVVKMNRYSAVVHGNSKYVLRYLKDTDVHALSFTDGIFLFKYKTDAEAWCASLNGYLDLDTEKPRYKVIRVLPLQRGNRISMIHNIGTGSLDDYYKPKGNGEFRFRSLYSPNGTYTHMSVRVLD